MSFCGSCGAPVSTASARFCAGCGAALAAPPLAPPPPVAPPLIARGPTPTPPPPPMLPPLKAAKKTNSGAFVVGFLSVMLLAGGITVMVMRDDAPAQQGPVGSTTVVDASTTAPATTGP